MNKDKLVKLHENLGKRDKNFTIDYNSFETLMQDETKRKKLWENLSEKDKNFTVGYDKFSKIIGFEPNSIANNPANNPIKDLKNPSLLKDYNNGKKYSGAKNTLYTNMPSELVLNNADDKPKSISTLGMDYIPKFGIYKDTNGGQAIKSGSSVFDKQKPVNIPTVVVNNDENEVLYEEYLIKLQELNNKRVKNNIVIDPKNVLGKNKIEKADPNHPFKVQGGSNPGIVDDEQYFNSATELKNKYSDVILGHINKVGSEIDNEVKNLRGRLDIIKKTDKNSILDTENINKLLSDVITELNKPSKLEKTNPWAYNYVEGFGQGITNRDTWTFGMTELARNINAGLISKKLDKGEPLQEDESLLISAFALNMAAKDLRSDDVSLAYQAGEGAAISLPYMIEFLGTAGLGAVAKEGILKAVTKTLGSSSAKLVEKWLGKKFVQETLGTAAMTVAMPTTHAAISRDWLDATMSGKEFGFKEKMRSFGTSFVENSTERYFGGVIDKGLGLVGKKMLGDRAKGLTRIGKVWNSNKVTRELPIHSPIGEMGEEYVGAGINYGRSFNPLYEDDSNGKMRKESKHLFTKEGTKILAGSILPITIIPGVFSMFNKGTRPELSEEMRNLIDGEYGNIVKNSKKNTLTQLNTLKNAGANVGNDVMGSKIIRGATNRSQALEALWWDKMRGAEGNDIFNGRVSNMKGMLEAVNSNNTEKLKEYGLTSQDDIDFVKQNFEDYIEESVEVKNNLDKNINKSVNLNSALRLTELQMATKNNLKELNRLKSFVAQAPMNLFEELNGQPELKNYLIVKAELESLQNRNNKTDSQIKRQKDLEYQMASMKSDTFDSFNLSKEETALVDIFEEQFETLKSNYRLLYNFEKKFNGVAETAAKLSTKQGQWDALKEEALDDYSSLSEFKDGHAIKQLMANLENLDLLTDERKNQINRRISEIKANELNGKKVEVVEEKPKEKPKKNPKKGETQDISSIIDDDVTNQESVKDAGDLLSYIESENETPNSPKDTGKEFDPFEFQGVGRLAAKETSVKERFKTVAKNHIDRIKAEGKKPSFRNFVKGFIANGKERTENAYDYIVQSWRDNNEEFDVNPEELDTELFDPDGMNDVLNLTDAEFEKTKKGEAVESGIIIDTNEKIEEEERLRKEAAKKKMDEEESKLYEANVIDSPQLVDVDNRVPFSGLEYNTVVNPITGEVSFVNKDVEELNPKTKSDLNILLDPTLLVPGTKFEIRPPESDWRDAKVNIWYQDKDKHWNFKTGTMREWMVNAKDSEGKLIFSKEDVDKNQSEWTKEQFEAWAGKVPMSMWVEGKKVGSGIHDVEWFNERNTASTTPEKQKEVKKGNRKKTLETRLAILEGNTQMVVTERISGDSPKIDETKVKPKRPLSQEIPDAIIGHRGQDGKFIMMNEDGTSTLIQDFQIENIDKKEVQKITGKQVVQLVRSNTDKNGNPMYIVKFLDTWSMQSQDRYFELYETKEILEAARKLYGKKINQEKTPLTKEEEAQLKEYETIRDQILKDTKNQIDIAEQALDKGFAAIENRYPHIPGDYGKNAVTRENKPVVKGRDRLSMDIGYKISLKDLPIVKRNADGSFEVSSVNYIQELRRNLTTENKYYKITNSRTGEPMYIAHYQPTIKFELVNKEAKKDEKPKVNDLEAKKADIEKRRQEELENGKSGIRVKVEVYETLDINGDKIQVTITTNADGSRNIRARLFNEDGSVEPMAYFTENINNRAQLSLSNEKVIEGYIGNEGGSLQKVSENLNPTDARTNKINAKYDAELAALESEFQKVDDILDNEIRTTTPSTETPAITKINLGQKQRVVNHLFAQVLKNLGNNDVNYGDVIVQLVYSYRNMLKMLSQDPSRKAEFEYLSKEEVKNELVGLGQFSENHNTLKEKLELYIDKDINESDIDNYEDSIEGDIDGDSNSIKPYDSSGFEFNVKSGLSSRLKRMFAAIPKVQSKSTLEEFAGLEDYYGIDEVFDTVQEILADIPNTVDEFMKALEKKLSRNPKNFEFLNTVKERFKESDKQLQYDILYKLNQTKNSMFFIMYEDEDGNFKFDINNANSKDVVDSIKRGFYESFKSSSIITRVGEGYILNMKEAEIAINTFNNWVEKQAATNYVNIKSIDIVTWLERFGINVTEKTIDDLRDEKTSGGIKFSDFFTSNLFKKLNENLVEKYKKQENTVKNKQVVEPNKFGKGDIVQNNTGGYINNLSAIESENIVKSNSAMRIAGKNVMPYSQPNFASEQVRKIKAANGIMLDNLGKSAFSKNSILLKTLKNSPKLKERFSVDYISLQAIKNRRAERNSDRAGITDLPETDFDTVLLAFNNSKTNPLKDATGTKITDNGIQLVEAKMAFPPLSDSSQLFVLTTAKYDITDVDLFDLDGNLKLSNRLLDVLYEQLVLPDLTRIIEYIQAKNLNLIQDDVDFQGLGSELFTIIHGLNTLKIGETDLLTLVRDGAGKNMTIDNLVSEEVTDMIKDYLENMILENINSKFNINEAGVVEGSWVKEGLITIDKNKGVKANLIDTAYLNKRSEKGNVTRKIKTATADFVINHLINQSQIQMVFSGDMNNYTEEPSKLFKKEWEGAKEALEKKKKNDETILDKTVTDTELFFEIINSKSDAERERLFNEYFKLTSTNLYKRLKEHLSPGNRHAESNGKNYLQIVINDKKTASESLKSIIKLWYPKEYKAYEDKIDEFKKLSEEIDNMIVDGKSTKEDIKEKKKIYKNLKSELGKAFPKVKDYMDIKSTDGQEFTTWKEHLDTLYYQGRLSTQEFDAITKKLQDQSANGVNKANKLSHAEKKAIFQPIKPLYAGLHFETKGSYTRQRFVYIKTSSFPLLPEITNGFELDKIRKNIEQYETEKKTNVRVTYKSGIKVGGVKDCLDVEEFYGEYESIKGKMESSTIVMDRENFSIQQDKPYKLDKNIEEGKDDENNRGTQIDKILFGNGISKVDRDVFPNMFDKELLEAVGIDSSKELLSGVDLYKVYNHIAITEQQAFRRDIFEELGIDSNNVDWYNSYETLDKIQNLLNGRMSNYQDREIIKLKIKTVGKDGKVRFVNKETLVREGLVASGAEFEIPLWISPNSQKFESVLNSIINNRFIKLKISGSSSPVGSEEGFKVKGDNTLSQKDKESIIFTDSYNGNLQATRYEDGSLKSAQVLLPSKFRRKVKYTDAKGRTRTKDELIDLTEYTKVVDGKTILDTDRLDKEILTHFSFRIPTSSHQSGAIIEVVGFLPHSAGDLMIVPKDHVTQIGEDFDIDVRYYYKQHVIEVVEDGVKKLRKLKESDIPKSSEESLDELYKNYNSEKQKIKEEMSQYISDTWRNNKEALYTLLFAKLDLEMIQENRITKTENGFVFDESVIEKEKELKKEIEFLENSLLSRETLVEKQNELKNELKDQLASLRNKMQSDKLQIISNFVTERTIDNVRKKIMENNMIALYKSIYSTKDEATQKKINATLSTDFANETANLIDENSVSDTRKTFSILDDISQKKALRLGASGKLGIGVHSKWVVFNSLLQQQEKPLRIVSRYIEDSEGNDIPVYMNMTIGKYTSEGYLGKPNGKGEFMTLDGDRSIATVNMENQNCSTDNQKLQIMGKRNENKYTINVLALLCNLGFDKATLADGKTDVHIPSLLISQPIIRRYVELMEQKDSMFTDYNKDALDNIKATLKEEFASDVDFMIKDEVETYYMENYDEASEELTGQNLLDNISNPTGKHQWAVFQKFLELNQQVQELNDIMNLLNIEKDGLGISFFNTIDKKDNLIYMMNNKYLPTVENASELFGESKMITIPVDSTTQDIEDYNNKVNNATKDGFIYLFTDERSGVEYYAKPTNSQNAKLINSIAVGYNLWKDIFPFEDTTIKTLISDIMDSSDIEEDSKRGEEMKYFILENMKDFIYSYDDKTKRLFDKSIEEDRKSLTVDNEAIGNESLAHYLHRLKSAPEGSYERSLMNETFFKNLELILFTDGSTPSYMKYSTNSKANINKNDAYVILESMLDSTQELPAYNGKENYTVHDLLRDLVKYSLIANQEKGAIGFRNYIPVSALKRFGVLDNLKKIATVKNNHYQLLFNGDFRALASMLKSSYDSYDNFILNRKGAFTENELNFIDGLISRINETTGIKNLLVREATGIRVSTNMDAENMSIFMEQFYQHNPDKAKKIPFKKKDSIITNVNSKDPKNLTSFELKEGNDDYDKPYLAIRNKDGSYFLYKNIGNTTFRRVPTLGSFGMNEYQTSKRVHKSAYSKNNFEFKSTGTKVATSTVAPVQNKTPETTSEVITRLISSTKDSKVKVLLQELKSYDRNIKVVPVKNLVSEKGLEGMFVPEEDIIYIDMDIFSNMDSEKFHLAFFEEYLHSITSNLLGEWIESSGITFKDGNVDVEIVTKANKVGVSRPYYIDKLIGLYKDGVKAYVNSFENKEEGIAKLNALDNYFKDILAGRDADDNSISSESQDMEMAYRVFSIDEFIAGMFVSPEFRKIMDNTEYRGTGKSILQHFKDVLKRVINTLTKNVVSDSITEHTIDTMFAMLNKKDTVLKDTNPIKEILEDTTIKDAKDILKDEERAVVTSEDGRYTTTYKKDIIFPIGNKHYTINSKTLLDFVNKSKKDKDVIGDSKDIDQVAELGEKYGKFVEDFLLDFNEYAITKTEAEFIRYNRTFATSFLNNFEDSVDDITKYAEKLLSENVNSIEDKNQLSLDFESNKDTQDISGILRPSFETLFSQGIIETQGFQLTLSEFNSMTKEEQENFKKCL